MPIYRVRKFNDTLLTKAGGNAPDTAGVGVITASGSVSQRTGGGGFLQFSPDGTFVQTAIDGSYGNKDIADGSATSLFEVPVAAAAFVGGTVFFNVQASNGTDHQSMTGMVTYSAVNKAGTCTTAITNAAANDAKAVSSGTLTLAWTCVDSTNKVTVKLQPTGSLTETTFRVTYFVMPITGAVTIL